MARPPKSLLKDSHPEIAAEVVDQSLLPTLATGADRKIEFRCPEGHIYEARPYNRTNTKTGGTGCPICNGKQILVGFNDLATTQPAVAAMCTNPEDTLTHTQFSNKKISFTCPQGHTWTAPVARIVEQSLNSPHLGCPYCSGRKSVRGKNDLATTHPELAKQLVDQSLAHTLKAGSNKQVEWQCEHGHVWVANPYNRITYDNNCPYCSNHRVQPGVTDLATTHPDIAQELADQSLATQYTAGSEATVEWRCNNGFDHTYKTTIHNRVQDKSHCSICNGKTVLPGFNDMATTNPDMAARLLNQDDAQRFTQSSGKAVMWRCSQDPTHTWENSPWKEGSNLLGLCPDCRPPSNSVSLMEQDIARVIGTLVGEEHVTTSRRDLLGRSHYELDIVIEHLKLAFEFNGLYWHCEINKPESNYHATKSMMAQKHGYQLIHI